MSVGWPSLARSVRWVGGGAVVARGVFEEAAAGRMLQALLLCCAGGERPARGGDLRRLAARLASGERFAATLGGARIEAGDEVLVARDAGERARGGLQPLDLDVGRAVVWDGRFEAEAAGPGWTLQPMAGLASRLSQGERARLREIPAAMRPALPVAVNRSATVTCPILAEGEVRLRPLARRRFLAAAGLAATERQADDLAHGEDDPHVLF